MKNIASLLFYRESNQSPCGRFNRGFEQSAVSRWAEADFLRHSSSEYVEFRPSPRSSIAAAFSPDGRFLASTHGDHTVKVTDVKTGRVTHSLAGHRRTPWVVRFSPVDPDILASGSLDSTAAIWQVSKGQMLHKYDFGKPIASLAFDPSGTMLVVSAGHKVFTWQFTRLAPPVKILKTRRSLRALHFHPTAPHILLTAEVTERRAGTAADVGAATTAAAAAALLPQQTHAHHHNPHQYQQQHPHQHQVQVHSQLADVHHGIGIGGRAAGGTGGGARIGALDESDPQEAVDDLAAFIAAHNNNAPSQLQQQQQQSQQEVAQQHQYQQHQGGTIPRASGARGPPNQGGAPWPAGLLRNLLMGVTGIFTGSLGGGPLPGAGVGSAAGDGGTVNQHGTDTALARMLRGTGSFATHGVNATDAVAGTGGGGIRYGSVASAGGGGGGAPSVNPGGGGVAWGLNPHAAQSAPTHGNAQGASGAPPGGGRLKVLSPSDVVRYQKMGGGVRHAIPLVAPLAAAPLREAHDSPALPLPDSHVAPYDLMWGWDHTLHMSESDIVRVRDLALRGAPDLPSAANHDTPCIVTVRMWDFRDPTRELRKELLVLPRVVLCSEMGIHFTSCGRYMVCCVVRESPSDMCLKWQADQVAAAAEGAIATQTHVHPPVGSGAMAGAGQGKDANCNCGCDFGDAEDGAAGGAGGELDEPEAAHAAAEEVRPRGRPQRDGGGGGEGTVGWRGDGDVDGAAQEYDDEYLYDTATQVYGQERLGNLGSVAAASTGWRGLDSGGSDRVDGDAGGTAISALSLQQRQQQLGSRQQVQEPRTRRQQQRHMEEVTEAEARTEVSRPGAASWEREYDSAMAVAHRKMGTGTAESAISGVARNGGDSGDGAEDADGDGVEVRPHGGSRHSISLSCDQQQKQEERHYQQQHQLHQNHQQGRPHVVENENGAANKSPSCMAADPHDLQLSREGAGPSAVTTRCGLRAHPLGAPAVYHKHSQNVYDPEHQGHQQLRRHNHHQHNHHHGQQQQPPPLPEEQTHWQQSDPQQPQAPEGAHALGRETEMQLGQEAPRGQGRLSLTDWPPARGTAPAAMAALHAGGSGGGGSDAGAVNDGGLAAASVAPPPPVQETPSTFASIKAHLALQRSRDGAAIAVGMYGYGVSRDAATAGGTVAGPEAQCAAPSGPIAGAVAHAAAAGLQTATTATAFCPPAVAAVGGAANHVHHVPTVAPGVAFGGGGTAATVVAAMAQPSAGFHPCYELCIFYTGTSPIPPTLSGPSDSATAPGVAIANTNIINTAAPAAPAASSSVAFPLAVGFTGPAVATMAAGGGSSIATAAAAPSTSSAAGPHFGSLLHARPVMAAHCMTSVQLSPAGDHVLVAYGRRHISLCSLVSCGPQLATVHSVVEIYSVPDMVLRRVLLSADDEVNVAVFNAFPAEGMAYGTKEGRLRLIRYDRRLPQRSTIPFAATPAQSDDEFWEPAARFEWHRRNGGMSMSVSAGELDGTAS